MKQSEKLGSDMSGKRGTLGKGGGIDKGIGG
jgi:hypothetical protein